MVTYTRHNDEKIADFLERAGYGSDYDALTKKQKPTLIANIVTHGKEVPSFEDLDETFKADGKGHGGHVAHKITALIRYFKHESAMRKKERKESGSGSDSPGKAPGVKGGIKKKH